MDKAPFCAALSYPFLDRFSIATPESALGGAFSTAKASYKLYTGLMNGPFAASNQASDNRVIC